MIKHARIFSFALLYFVAAFTSCTKINEGTELGGDLIPVVDNVNTFETSFEVVTDNRTSYYNDSTKLSFYDLVALGQLNDPEFGATNASVYFNFFRDSARFGLYPFIARKDSITIDSVVLSLSYQGGYGDSVATQSLSVFELPQNTTFKDSAFYNFNHQPDFAVGNQIGTRSYRNADLNDSIVVKAPSDTIARKVANVLRIRLNNSFGERLKISDSNAYRSYEIFHTIFPGLGIRPNSGNALSYFDLTDLAKSRISVYYKARIGGRDSAAVTDFTHYVAVPLVATINPPNFINGKANLIRRTPGGGYATYGATGTVDPLLHIQSAPGSVAYITIPGLDTVSNKVVHRAELIVSRVTSAGDDKFEVPGLLFLDHITANKDTGFTFFRDFSVNTTGQYDYQNFGGLLRTDGTYRFNITRYVQGILTRNEPNDTLRLYAPYRTNVSDRNLITQGGSKLVTIPVISRIAYGRVVVAGGNYIDPSRRMRLRVIYSKL